MMRAALVPEMVSVLPDAGVVMFETLLFFTVMLMAPSWLAVMVTVLLETVE
jgi:hypothetical protein